MGKKVSLKKYFFIFLICNLPISFSDNLKVLKPMELNEKIKGKMDSNDSREYYELRLPKEVQPGSLLVFTVKESRTGVREGEELFSDPDIYVSKSMKFPSNREEADWYSERYGNDILTISDIKVNDTFYVGIYCQFKCRYTIFHSLIWDFF